MLDALKKAVGVKVEVDTQAVQAELASLRADFDSFQAEANALLEVAQADNEQLAADLAATQEKLDAALAQVEQLQAAAASAVDEAAAQAAAAEALRQAARTEKLTAAVGTEKAPALLAAFADLDDAKFDAVLAAMVGQAAAEAASEMFNEVGATADVVAPAALVENETLRILRERYKQD